MHNITIHTVNCVMNERLKFCIKLVNNTHLDDFTVIGLGTKGNSFFLFHDLFLVNDSFLFHD